MTLFAQTLIRRWTGQQEQQKEVMGTGSESDIEPDVYSDFRDVTQESNTSWILTYWTTSALKVVI